LYEILHIKVSIKVSLSICVMTMQISVHSLHWRLQKYILSILF